MVKQKKRTRITQSGKNNSINCAIQGVRLIWKQKIWLAICEFLWSLTNQNAWFVTSFYTEGAFTRLSNNGTDPTKTGTVPTVFSKKQWTFIPSTKGPIRGVYTTENNWHGSDKNWNGSNSFCKETVNFYPFRVGSIGAYGPVADRIKVHCFFAKTVGTVPVFVGSVPFLLSRVNAPIM